MMARDPLLTREAQDLDQEGVGATLGGRWRHNVADAVVSRMAPAY